MKIKDIMTKDVVTVGLEDTVEKCANLLIKNDISGLPVLDDKGKVIGMVTEGDLIRRISKIKGPAVLEILGGLIYFDSPKKLMSDLEKSMGYLASEVMTKDIVTVSPDEDVERAATLLVENKVKRLPVVDNEGKLIGIIARKDIMNYLFTKE